MASLHDVEVAILNAVTCAVGPQIMVGSQRVEIKAAIGWPQLDLLQDIAKKAGHEAVIAIYDRKISKNSTRWSPLTLSTTQNPTGITSALSNDILPAGGTMTVTVGGAVLPNDAISLLLGGVSRETVGQVFLAANGSSVSDVAAGLAALVNGSVDMSPLVTAAAAGPVITLTSKISGDLQVTSATGNTAVELREVARRQRQFQIVVWARTEEERIAVTDPIDRMIASVESIFGLQLGDGTWGRLIYVNDHDIDDGTLEDVLRRDFYVSVDYAITTRDMLYAVLAPIQRFTVE